MLLTLAAVWGASYLFIKVAVDEIEPAPMMAFRTLVAAAILLAYVASRRPGRVRLDLLPPPGVVMSEQRTTQQVDPRGLRFAAGVTTVADPGRSPNRDRTFGLSGHSPRRTVCWSRTCGGPCRSRYDPGWELGSHEVRE